MIDLLLEDVQKRLSEREIILKLTDAAKAWLIKEGYEPSYGARPLRRAIQHHIENPLSKRILDGDFKEGDKISADYGADGLFFKKRKSRASKKTV